MPPELSEVRLSLRKADHDFRAVQAALEAVTPITDVAAFHCQQAVEKTLKVFPGVQTSGVRKDSRP